MQMLAIHGLTGYGRRWRHLAGYVPEIGFAAPDLLGHGRSSWAAPWTFDANVSALAALLDERAEEPVLVVGHSFGGGWRCSWPPPARTAWRRCCCWTRRSGWTAAWMREIADGMFSSPDYPDAEGAHGEGGRPVGRTWTPRCSAPKLTSISSLPTGDTVARQHARDDAYWSELARDIVLPPAGTPTTLVRAKRHRRPMSATS